MDLPALTWNAPPGADGQAAQAQRGAPRDPPSRWGTALPDRSQALRVTSSVLLLGALAGFALSMVQLFFNFGSSGTGTVNSPLTLNFGSGTGIRTTPLRPAQSAGGHCSSAERIRRRARPASRASGPNRSRSPQLRSSCSCCSSTSSGSGAGGPSRQPRAWWPWPCSHQHLRSLCGIRPSRPRRLLGDHPERTGHRFLGGRPGRSCARGAH